MVLPVAVGFGFLVAFLAPVLYSRLRERTGWWLAVYPLGVALLAGGLLLSSSGRSVEWEQPWVPELGVALSFRADGLSLLFVLLISVIGALVLVYGSAYLRGQILYRAFPGSSVRLAGGRPVAGWLPVADSAARTAASTRARTAGTAGSISKVASGFRCANSSSTSSTVTPPMVNASVTSSRAGLSCPGVA